MMNTVSRFGNTTQKMIGRRIDENNETEEECREGRSCVEAWQPGAAYVKTTAYNQEQMMATPAQSASLKWLINAVIKESALKRGDTVANFSLPDRSGTDLNLFERLEQGPVVIQFFRGDWCPHSAADLRILEKIVPDIKALGASPLAISPQRAEFSQSTTTELALTFPVLTDLGNVVAKRFGIVYKLSQGMLNDMKAAGVDLLVANGESGRAELPIPSTYIVDSEKLVRLATIQEEWTSRVDPGVVLDSLRSFWEAD
jgi:peroxiredoxin